MSACRLRHHIEPVETLKKQQRRIVRTALVHRSCEQVTRGLEIASLVRGNAGVRQLFGLALPFGERAARAIKSAEGKRLTYRQQVVG